MLKKYIKRALKEKWAIGQFNFSTLDQLKAIVESSKKMKSPVILGTSEKEASFFGIEEAAIIVSFYKKKDKIPIFLNLDHGNDLEKIKKCIDVGYDMVHFDGSKKNIKDNIKDTVDVLKYAHKKNILVEGEIGRIFGKSALHKKRIKVKKEFLISAEGIVSFFRKTKVDLLAVAIGNVHGVYDDMPSIDFDLLKEIKKNKIPLVFHGGSGVSDKDIKRVIKTGVVKININTELRIMWKESLKKSLKSSEFAPYFLLQDSQKKVSLKVEEKIKIFGSKEKL